MLDRQVCKINFVPTDPNGRINIQNWRFMCLTCGVVVPRNKVILNYLQAHLRRCSLDPHTDEGKYAQFAMQVSNHTATLHVGPVSVVYL